ncbi:MAG: DUF4238 domain-containing protein [Candidatus Nitrosopumilus sp. bin_7KS]
MKGIKSHFVPQTYLKNFGERFFQYDKQRGKINEATPKTVAHKSDFYGPEIEGKHPLETAFSQIEGKINFALKELMEKHIVSKKEDEYFKELCEFIALQYIRTDEKRQQIGEMGNFAFRELFIAEHPEFDNDLVNRLFLTDEFNLKIHLNAISEYQRLAHVISKMKFIVLKNNTSSPFWTSDNPIALFNSIDYTPYSGLGPTVEGIEIHVPIEPKITLLVCDPKKFEKYPDVLICEKPFNVLQENWLQFDSSTRFLFSNNSKFSEIRKFQKIIKSTNQKKKNNSRVISGQELQKKELVFWADKETLAILDPQLKEKERPPFIKANPNIENIMTSLKRTKSIYDPRIYEVKFD